MILATALASNTFAQSETASTSTDLKKININNGFADLVNAVKSAVVNVSVKTHSKGGNSTERFGFNGDVPPQLEEFLRRYFGNEKNNNPQGPGNNAPAERQSSAVGSGFVIDASGLIVTNHHVIEQADEIEVIFDDGTRIPAKLKGTDPKTDLALLEIETDYPLSYVEFGDSEAANVGDWVIAIGNPFGLGGTTTSGIISARGRDIRSGPLDDFIQIDASINRGNSGGPLFNTQGKVIGVNSAIFSPNGGSVGIGFAIPSSMAKNVINQLKDTGTVQRGYLGVHIQRLNQDLADTLGLEKPYGALVTQVIIDSPAEKAGIEAGDIILKYNGETVKKMRDLPKLVALSKTGEKVKVTLWRNEKTKIITVAVGDSKLTTVTPNKPAKSATLGLVVANIDSQSAHAFNLDPDTKGVVITNIEPNSIAANKDLRPGDIIISINKTLVTQAEEVKIFIETAKKNNKKSALLKIERNGRARYIALPINK